MIYKLVKPEQINWDKQTILANLEGKKLEVPIAFTTTTIFTRLKSDQFKAVLLGNTRDDMIAILVFQSQVQKEE